MTKSKGVFSLIVAAVTAVAMIFTISTTDSFAYLIDSDVIVDHQTGSCVIEFEGDDVDTDMITCIREWDHNSGYELKKGVDYVIDPPNRILIKYDFLASKYAGDKKKKTISDSDTLYVWFKNHEGVKTFWQYNVPNWNINIMDHYYNDMVVYSGKNTKVDFEFDPDRDDDNTLVEYKVTYAKKSRKAIGKYKFYVKGKFPYTGKYTYYYKVVPKRPSYKSVKRAKSYTTLKWSKVSNCSGYQVKFLTNKTSSGSYKAVKTFTVKDRTKISKKFKISRTSYNMIKLRSYKVVDGKRIYSYDRLKIYN